MRYPFNNFIKDFNTTAGYSFGAVTSYGRHEGTDINGNGGGDIDLGIPIYAIADGELQYYHTAKHPNTGFGYHNVYKIVGSWGTRWIHGGHQLSDLLTGVKTVKEGQQIGRIGKSGTTWAHCHFAVFKVDPATLRDGIDTIARNVTELNAWWEDPIIFMTKYINATGGGSNMANMYKMKSGKEVDIANPESNKVLANVYDEVINQGLWVKKTDVDAGYVKKVDFDNLRNEFEDYKRRHPDTAPTPTNDPVMVEKLRKIGEVVRNSPEVQISEILKG